MKLKLISITALILFCAGLAVSQQPAPSAVPQAPPAEAYPPSQPPMIPQQPPRGQHAPMGPQPAQPYIAPQPPVPPADPLGQNLFPPELVMQHKQEIGLTDEQKAAIREELLKASTRFNELQFQMQDEMENLVSLTKGTTIDEQRVLAQLDKVLSIEREVKRAQIAVSVRIKNKLTAEQQARLQELRHIHPSPR